MVNINKLNSYENVIIDSDLAKIEDLIQFLQSNKCHKCGGDISQGMPARKCKFTKNKSPVNQLHTNKHHQHHVKLPLFNVIFYM